MTPVNKISDPGTLNQTVQKRGSRGEMKEAVQRKS